MQGLLSDKLTALFSTPAVKNFREVKDSQTYQAGTIKLAQMLLEKTPAAYFAEVQELILALLFEGERQVVHPAADIYVSMVGLCAIFLNISTNQATLNPYSERLFKLSLNFAKTLAEATAHIHEMGTIRTALHQATVILPTIQAYKKNLARLNGRSKDYSWFVENLSEAFLAAVVTGGHRTKIDFLDLKIMELHKIMQNRVDFYMACQRAVLLTQAVLVHQDPSKKTMLIRELSDLKAQLALVHDEPKALFKRNPIVDSHAPNEGKEFYRNFVQEFNSRLSLLERIISSHDNPRLKARFAALHKQAISDIEILIRFPLAFYHDPFIDFIMNNFSTVYEELLRGIINTCKQKMLISLVPHFLDIHMKFQGYVKSSKWGEINSALTEFRKEPLPIQKIILFYGIEGSLKNIQDDLPEVGRSPIQLQVKAQIATILASTRDEPSSSSASSSLVLMGGAGGAESSHAATHSTPAP